MRFGERTRTIVVYVGMAIALVYTLFPIGWSFISSLQSNTELFQYPPRLTTTNPWYKNYYQVFTGRPMGGLTSTVVQKWMEQIPRAILNTFAMSAGATLLSLLVASLAAFGLSRSVLRGKTAIMMFMLSTRSIPFITFLIPLYVTMQSLGLTDNLLGLILVCSAVQIPFATLLLKNYFDTIPRDLHDAGMVDGCSTLEILYKIYLPLSLPGIMVTSVMVFLLSWGAFLIPLILTKSEAVKTITLLVAGQLSQSGTADIYTDYGMVNAVALVSCIPPLVLLLIFQKYIVEGLIKGAMKY